MSRNWPIVTSRRIVAYSVRAAARVADGCRGQSLFEKVVAPRHEQVAEQDCARPAEGRGIAGPAVRAVRGLERAMRGGAAAARVGVVDHVVVHERGGVEDLERGRGGDDLRGRRRRGPRRLLHCPPPGDAEPPAEALSAVQSASLRPRRGAALRARDRPLRLAGPRGSCSDAGKSLRRHPERVTRA